MKLLALLLMCGPMLLGTAACSSKVCAAQAHKKTKTEVYGAGGSGVQGAAAGAQLTGPSLQSSLQVSPAPTPQQSGAPQVDPTPSSDGDDSSGAVVVAAQNPPVAAQVVPPHAPPEEAVEVHHNDEDC